MIINKLLSHLNNLSLSQLPDFINKMIDPDTFKRKEFIYKCSQESPEGSYILDAGAGQCPYKGFFNKQKYIATDLSVGDINWDYSKLDVLSNLETLPFKNNVFHSIICINVLEHVKEPFNVISEFYRVLKPGGSLYVTVPQGWWLHQEPYDYFRYTNYGISYLLEKAHFFINDIKPTSGYFSYLANRITFLPKALFWTIKSKIIRILLLPFEIISYLLFVLLIPIILNCIDGYDKQNKFTLHYMVKASK